MPKLKSIDLRPYIQVLAYHRFKAWVKPGPYKTYCGLMAQCFGEQLEAMGVEYRILVSRQGGLIWYTVRRTDFEPGILDP